MKSLCCCGDDVYDEIAIGDSDEEEDGVWELNLFGTTSSESEDDGALNVETCVFSGDEDSVEDEEYYHRYRTNLHHAVDQETLRPTSAKNAARCVKMARAKANASLETMSRTEYAAILALYEEAVERCPVAHNRLVIKEYEVFKHVYVAFYQDTEDYAKAMEVARLYWMNALQRTENQEEYYRRAIMCVPDAKIRRQWKKEYNVFLRAQLIKKS